jgi:translocation and assembly module TamB
LIDYPARLGADPILNIQAQTVIRGYRVTATIDGPLSHPNTTVGSEPALPQADVVSLILTGSLSSTDASTSVLAQSGLGTAASLLTDALINAPVSRASNKLFGLSRLEISPVIGGTGSAPTARLTVARRISKDVTVTYSTNIASDPNQVLAVEYRVSNRLSFVAQYEQGSLRNLSTRNNNYSFEIRFRKRF